MIKSTYRLGGDNTEVIVRRDELMFFDVGAGVMTTLDGLKISKGGVIKEFPDLEEDDEWKKKAIERLKENIKKYKTEMDKTNYVKDELIKFGYEPLFYQRAGHRPKKFKDEK